MELRPSRYALAVRDQRRPEKAAGNGGHRSDGRDAGGLAVGFTGTALTAVLPEALTAFGRRHPRVRLELVEAPSAEQIAQLLAGHLDVGFICGPVPAPARDHLVSVPLTRDRLVAAVPDASSQNTASPQNTASRRPLPLAALAGRPLIVPSRQAEPAVAGAALAMCRTAGFEPVTVIEASGPHTLLGLVACGLGVGIGPESMRRLRYEGVTLLEITPAAPVIAVQMVHRAAAAGPVLRDLRRIVRAVCPGPSHTAPYAQTS